MFINVNNAITSLVLQIFIIQKRLMSLYTVADMDIPSVEILAKQLDRIALDKQAAYCSFCKKVRKEELLVFINH